VEFFDFPESLRPFDPLMGWAYDKIWCDDPVVWDKECDGKAYERWGVDRVRGAMFILRPDQYVGWVGELEDVEGVTRYLDGFLTQNATPSAE
jgi:phenol 2-monooxygenase